MSGWWGLALILVLAAVVILVVLEAAHRAERAYRPRHRRQFDGRAPIEPGFRPGLVDGQPIPRGPGDNRG